MGVVTEVGAPQHEDVIIWDFPPPGLVILLQADAIKIGFI